MGKEDGALSCGSDMPESQGEGTFGSRAFVKPVHREPREKEGEVDEVHHGPCLWPMD
jgi:hypothetical protein